MISDFKSFSYLFAKVRRLPIISIDNMQIISRTKLNVPVPSAGRGNHSLAKSIVRAKLPHSRQYAIERV